MRAGLIADLVIIVIVIAVIAVCTKRGLMRSALRIVSNALSLVIAIFVARPFGNFLNQRFGLLEKVEGWHVPLVPASALYYFLVGVALFVVARLILILLDRLTKALKDKVRAINAIDRVLGSVFGLVLAVVIIGIVFFLVDLLHLQNALQLTQEAGGFLGWRLFDWYSNYAAPFLSNLLSAATQH